MAKYERMTVIATMTDGTQLTFNSCADAGKHFGCSRENVRLLSNKPYRTNRKGISFQWGEKVLNKDEVRAELAARTAIIIIDKETMEKAEFSSYRKASIALGKADGYFSQCIRKGQWSNDTHTWIIPATEEEVDHMFAEVLRDKMIGGTN